MKILILFTIFFLTFVASAERYNQIGNTLYKNDGTRYNTIGNTTYGSDGSDITVLGILFTAQIGKDVIQ